MERELNRYCKEILHCTSIRDYKTAVGRFANSRGMRTFGSTVITDHSPTMTEFQYITNAASEYLADYEDLESAKIDPVSQHAKRSSNPIVWNQSTYVETDTMPLWEHQATFGYCSGITLALHLPRGRHFMFGVDCDRQVCFDRRHERAIVEAVSVFAAHAQAAAFDLCAGYKPIPEDNLEWTPIELEPLRWSVDGLTNWEIGERLGISEREVARRLHRAGQRLSCATRYETVLRAIRLGLIDCD